MTELSVLMKLMTHVSSCELHDPNSLCNSASWWTHVPSDVSSVTTWAALRHKDILHHFILSVSLVIVASLRLILNWLV